MKLLVIINIKWYKRFLTFFCSSIAVFVVVQHLYLWCRL